MERLGVVVTAGGSGLRMGGPVPKQFADLCGRPVLMWTLERLRAAAPAADIVLTLPRAHAGLWADLCGRYRFGVPHRVVDGGAERFHSVSNGLAALEGCRWVAVHDGVRPMVSAALVGRCLDAVRVHGAVVPAVRPVDSVRQGSPDDSRPLDRASLFLVQTPQCFDLGLLKSAYSLPFDPSLTDDASVVERAGHRVHVVEGDPGNRKITYAADLEYCAFLMRRGEAGAAR